MEVDASNDTEMQRGAEKCKIETAESVSSEEFTTQVNWSDLPFLPLERIFSFLDPFDRVNMSLVCHTWFAGFSSPSLWKTFRFALTESMISDNCPMMKSVLKYSKLFRHVNIKYCLSAEVPRELNKIWSKHFVVFLQNLARNSQLISIKIKNLDYYFYRTDDSTRAYLKRVIAEFLGSQRFLKKVELINFSYIYQEYQDILTNIYKNSEATIEHFKLLGSIIFELQLELSVSNQYNFLTMLKYPNLKTLSIDYTRIFENTFACQSDVMKALRNCQNRAKLSKIFLKYGRWRYIGKTQGLKSPDWQFLKKLYPDLHVFLNFKAYRSSWKDVEFLIVPEMPIVHLSLKFAYDNADIDLYPELVLNDMYLLFGRLFQRMVTDRLESLCLNWAFYISNLSSAFIKFITEFKNLKYLGIFITPAVNGVDLLMESLAENRPGSLKDVYIKISDVETDHDYKISEKLATECVSRLKLVGLNTKVDIRGKKTYQNCSLYISC